MGRWRVEHRTGDASQLHAASMPLTERTVRVHRVTHPAIVLGSTQADATVDPAALARHGLQLARRRSGGGAVHLDPATSVWIDLSIPASDPLWVDDVERAAWWVGDAWASALGGLAAGSSIEVHRRGLSDKELGRIACFASLGPGEVTLDRRKVVGISQRRTREGARFQCVAASSWDPSVLLDVLGVRDPDAALRVALHDAAGALPAPGEQSAPSGDSAPGEPAVGGWSVVEGLLHHLP